MSDSANVKICGLKTEAALRSALEAGADYVGLVFFAKSPRNLDLITAGRLAEIARAETAAHVVALLVDPEDQLVADVVREVQPDLLQLHGSESLKRVEEIRSRWGVPVMKAVGVRSQQDVREAAAYYEPGKRADLILFDAKPPRDQGGVESLPGGNGLTFDWRILAGVPADLPFALAGGLRPENVAEAVRLTGAQIVDVSSGVETRPGEKSPELIRTFLNAAKTAKQ